MTNAIGRQNADLINLENPQDSDICSGDIGVRLDNICRWHGAGNRFYSVAEHSLRCFAMSAKLGFSAGAMSCLLHDAHEAYTGDIAGPLRALWLEDSDKLERICAGLDAVIYNHYQVEQLQQWNGAIDQVLLYAEAAALMPKNKTLHARLSTVPKMQGEIESLLGAKIPFGAFSEILNSEISVISQNKIMLPYYEIKATEEQTFSAAADCGECTEGFVRYHFLKMLYMLNNAKRARQGFSL